MADSGGRLSHAAVFRLFMDIAGDHAERIGVGIGALKAKGLFWLTVKTKVRYFDRPRLFEPLTVRTWPMAPEKVRALRCYELLSGDRLVAAGKTEWAVMNTETGRLAPLAGVYPEGFVFSEKLSLGEPFFRIAPPSPVPYSEYRVRSTDTDVGGHMNNVAYVDALMGSFSSEELRAIDPYEIEAAFRAPCFEGDRLVFFRGESAETVDVSLQRDGAPVFLARLLKGQRE